MDTKWAVQRLEEFVSLADEYIPIRAKSSVNRTELAERILGLAPQALAIVRTRRKYENNLAYPIGHNDPAFLEVTEGRFVANQVLNTLRTESETAEHLGPSGPLMSADKFHPLVWDAARSLWGGGHYGQAVQRAATFLNAHVQDRLGRHDVSDASLMREAFSDNPPQHAKPRLRWPGDPSNLTVKSMNDGLRAFAPGCFMTIRNPSTHTTRDIPEQEALEQLAALSLLTRWIDTCVVVSA